MAGPAGPLDGIKVLDLCSYLAGPYGCTLLADFGADVVKIESPQGDMLRQFPSSLGGESRFFLGTNRGKRALALDLKQPEGLAVLHRMVASADVLVENFRPGTLDGCDCAGSKACSDCAAAVGRRSAHATHAACAARRANSRAAEGVEYSAVVRVTARADNPASSHRGGPSLATP